MIEGTLVINLDPPYMGFLPKSSSQFSHYMDADTWCNCTLEQIKSLLIDLDVITPAQHWPPRECILRLPVVLPRERLAKHGLATLRNLETITIAKPAMMRRIS